MELQLRESWILLTKSSLFAYGLNTGGPGVMTVGWIIVSFFSTLGTVCLSSEHN